MIRLLFPTEFEKTSDLKSSFFNSKLLNLSLNQTLSRTIITSLTTLLVLFALFFFGGETVKGFSLGLIIGVLIGTYSSLYIVTSILDSIRLSQDDMVVPDVEGADFDDIP